MRPSTQDFCLNIWFILQISILGGTVIAVAAVPGAKVLLMLNFCFSSSFFLLVFTLCIGYILDLYKDDLYGDGG
jgi:hypothetical protein